jgi:orotate phosphoribosyltransferase
MEKKAFKVSLEKNPLISIKVIPGHFTTNNMHLNYYLDVSGLKSDVWVAKDVAQQLAIPYLSRSIVDTIVCLEKTEVIAAFLANELQMEGQTVMNSENNIHIVTPINNVHGNMMFHDNVLEYITNKNILLLIATISSGRAMNIAMECIEYYGGRLAGVSALFVASHGKLKYKVNTLFNTDDIPEYKLFSIDECEMCKVGVKIDAFVNNEGYTKIQRDNVL